MRQSPGTGSLASGLPRNLMHRISRQRYRRACDRLVAWLSSPMTARDLDDVCTFLVVRAKRANRFLPSGLLSLERTVIDRSARRPAKNLEAEFAIAWRALWSALCRLAAVAVELAGTYSQAAAFAITNTLFVAFVAVFAKAAPLRSRTIVARSYYRHSLSQRRTAAFQFRRCARCAMRTAEMALWAVAIVTIGYCGYVYTSATVYQAREKDSLRAKQVALVASNAEGTRPNVRVAPLPDQVLGMLEIPRIGLRSVVEQGDDWKILNRSIGHIPGTALPGSHGNVGLAGHRDSFFRNLGELEPGDEITFQTTSAIYKYKVRSTSIVDPSDVAVLRPTGEPTLTLVTCYPFHYIGSAPKRFILIAERTDTLGAQ
jgi:sortase A